MNSKVAKLIFINLIVAAVSVFATWFAITHYMQNPTPETALPESFPQDLNTATKPGEFDGVMKLASDISGVEMKFASGEMRIDYNNIGEINWDCDGAGADFKVAIDPKSKKAVMDFSGAFVDCDISIPAKALRIVGGNGRVEVRQIQASLDIDLQKGSVYLDPVDKKAYKYDIKADNPESEDMPPSDVDKLDTANPFLSSNQADSIFVKIHVKIGAVIPLSEAEEAE